jgi:predicted ABC-type ATPase
MDTIYNQLTKGVRKPVKHKIGVCMCGTSGSGKTSNRDKFLDDMGIKTTYVLLNLDNVWEISKHEDARDIFKQIIVKTIDDGYSFYYEGTCRSPKYILPKLEQAKKNGYTLKLGFVYAELDTVIKRVKQRSEQPMTVDFAKLVYSQVKKHAHEYMTSDVFDEIYLYNNQKTSKLIFYKDAKEIHCISPDSRFYFDVSKYC